MSRLTWIESASWIDAGGAVAGRGPHYKCLHREREHVICTADNPTCWCRPTVREFGDYVHVQHHDAVWS